MTSSTRANSSTRDRSASRDQVILHADMDAFYASVEQRDRPELRGRPVIVGGTGPRGVVSAASYEARALGVRAAMPGIEARRICPEGVFLPGRMEHYVAVSHEIQAVFEQFTPVVEPLSLDEAFLDVTESLRLMGTPRTIALDLKARVRDRTSLVVSVGIGPSKMVAKIASALSKPDGLLEVEPDGVAAFLSPLPIDHLWGVGPVTQASLRRAGFERIGDIARANADQLRRVLGHHGVALWDLANGRDARAVDSERERKSYGEENTFDRDVGCRQADQERLTAAIIAHAEAVAARLRRDGRRGHTVTLKVRLAERIGPGRYPLLSRRVTLAAPTDDGKLLSDTAIRLWREWELNRKVRLIGVAVSEITDGGVSQLSLFDGSMAGTPKRTALNQAVDDITSRFGAGSIRRGAAQAPKASPTLTIKDRPRSKR